MRLRFRALRLVDAEGERPGDLLVVDGRIAALGPEAGVDAAEAASGAGPRADLDFGGTRLVLAPAFVDLHAHLREPGFPEKETLESACLAAAAGGFGSLVAMANTRPVTEDPEAALAARRRAAVLGLVDLYPALAATRGLEGREAGHLDRLAAAFEGEAAAEAREGLRLISDDGRDLATDEVLLGAMRRAAALGILVAWHCERGEGGAGDPGPAPYSSARGRAADRRAEFLGVERAIRLGREAGCRLHLCHLSTRESLDLVRQARAAPAPAHGFRLTCEITPHHLALGETEAEGLGAAGAGRVNPWLRGAGDRAALAEALADGTADAIATDHAPHTAADKAAGAPGFSGLETAFALCHSELVAGGKLGFPALSRLLSAGPAAILGLADRGLLKAGLRADLVLLDPEAPLRVEPETFRSRGRNSPLAGRELAGRVLMTLHGGRIVHDET